MKRAMLGLLTYALCVYVCHGSDLTGHTWNRDFITAADWSGDKLRALTKGWSKSVKVRTADFSKISLI